jgi:hypothetical protein
MNNSKSTKRKHKLRTLRSRYARQFRGGAAATTDFISFITGSDHDNKIITTIIIAALFSGIYKQDETVMFNIAIKHILKGLTRANLEYVRRLMNAPHDVVDKALVYADKKTGREYDPAVEMINGGSRRRTKNRLHLRRKSHKYKLQSGGDRYNAIIAAMLFLFIMSCWFLFSVLMDLTAPQLSNTLKDTPGVIKRAIPNIPFSDSFLDADYKKNMINIFEALNILIAQLNIGFPTNISIGEILKTSYTGVLPPLHPYFVETVNRSLTTPICGTAINQIGSGLYNLSDIAIKNHHMPSVWSGLFGGYTEPIAGSTENERFMLTQGWARDALRKIFQEIIPKELASQFSKSITDKAERIILSSSGAFVSFLILFGASIRNLTRSMTSRRSRRSKIASSRTYNVDVEDKKDNGSYALKKPMAELEWVRPPPYSSGEQVAAPPHSLPSLTPPHLHLRERNPDESETDYNDYKLDFQLDAALAAMEWSMHNN